MKSRRAARGFSSLLGAVLASAWLGCASFASEPQGPQGAFAAPGEEQIAGVMAVLDQYMDALNRLDIEGHVATYHFPHYRHASGQVAVWADAREAMPILAVPVADRRAAIRDALEPDWHRSEWTRREIVQHSPTKFHVATQFVRLREDKSVIVTFDSLYVLTFEDGRWGIKGRSSFAP